MSHKILYSQKQNKEDSGMNIIDIKGLRELLNASPDKLKEADSDFIKSIKQRFTFGQTDDVKPKAQASAPFAPHYLGVGVPPLFGGGDVQKDNKPGLLDVFFQANQKWYSEGKN